MSKFVLVPLTPEQAAGRPSVNTGIAMLGRKGDDFICGHCSRPIIQSYDIAPVRPDMVYVCGKCGGNNAAPDRH